MRTGSKNAIFQTPRAVCYLKLRMDIQEPTKAENAHKIAKNEDLNMKVLKKRIHKQKIEYWQKLWDDGSTGRSTHKIIPRVINRYTNWS